MIRILTKILLYLHWALWINTYPLLGNTSQKNQLIYGDTTFLQQLDPYTAHEAAAKKLSHLIFDSLIEVDIYGNYQPSLATAWKISSDKSSINLTLRKGVLWHPSTPFKEQKFFSAKDVVTTIRLQQSPRSQIPNRKRFQYIQGVSVQDQHHITITFRLILREPLRFLTFKILPYHILGATPGLRNNLDFVRHPYGTGPYRFIKANQEGEIFLKSNPSYYKGRPKIDEIFFKSFIDPGIMIKTLSFGAIDLVSHVSPQHLIEILGDRKLQIQAYEALSFSFIAINNRHPFLKSKKVRQALSYAINRKEMLKAFYLDKGTLISGPFSPSSWAYNYDIKPIQYNFKKALKFLRDENFLQDPVTKKLMDRKLNKPVKKLIFVSSNAHKNEMTKRVILAIQSYLGKIGLDIEVIHLDWQNWKKRVLRDRNYDLTIATWKFDDSANIMSLFHSQNIHPWGNNFVQFHNTTIDTYLTSATISHDFLKKRSLYKKLHGMLAEETPYIFLWTLPQHAAYKKDLHGVSIRPLEFFDRIIHWHYSPTAK